MRRTALLLLLALGACGARTGLVSLDASVRDVPVIDMPAPRDLGVDAPAIDMPPPRDLGTDFGPTDGGCVPRPDGCLAREICGNGADDDCNGLADDGCRCEPGMVQRCFNAPPGRRNVGICSDGMQTCTMARSWGSCEGAILPMTAVCNGADNRCDGCSAEADCPISCPSPGDPRTPDGMPFAAYPLQGELFYAGIASAWSWTVQGGPCDAFAPSTVSFTLDGAATQDATFTPRLSGDYTVTLRVTTVMGTSLTCSWIVHVRGPGLRVEMCYPESTTQDLDLYVHRPLSMAAWFDGRLMATAFTASADTCGWHDCEATIRGTVGRADWGYATTPVANCVDGPHGMEWAALGFCSNPRLDVDNNLAEGTGLPENINVDDPRDGDTFRVMVQNYTGTLAHPVVNVYCGGLRVATFGAAPDMLAGYAGAVGSRSVGAMWRVADVTVHVDATGATASCDVVALHPAGATSGYDVTFDDPTF